MRHNRNNKLAAIFLISVLLTFSVSLWAAVSDSSRDISVISEHIFDVAADLRAETDKPVLDSAEINFLLKDMKDLIKDYENMLVFAECPYPGEIMLGQTPKINDGWHETECVTRYDGPFKEIRIRRTGSGARYLRINDIELTYMTPRGPEKVTLNKSGRERLYTGSVFRLALPEPMRVIRIRIAVEHASNGLVITGVPQNAKRPRPRVERPRQPVQVLLGTTPRGNDSWVETLCSGSFRPVQEIQLKRTGRRSGYLRINDIEVTYRTPSGLRKIIFNRSGREKLYYDQTFTLVLPEPMRVTRIRILVEHETTGLRVYGIY